MFRHVVMFRWAEGTSPGHVQAVEEALGRLPGAIPQIRAYAFGPDAGVNEGNYDFAVVADFDGVEDYVAYRDHPEHQAVIAELFRDHVTARAAVQFESP
jgi:hypothetical protein